MKLTREQITTLAFELAKDIVFYAAQEGVRISVHFNSELLMLGFYIHDSRSYDEFLHPSKDTLRRLRDLEDRVINAIDEQAMINAETVRDDA